MQSQKKNLNIILILDYLLIGFSVRSSEDIPSTTSEIDNLHISQRVANALQGNFKYY